MQKKVVFFIVFILASFLLRAQVTTSSISGTISDGQEAVIAATIVATHTPSGTRYYSTSDLSGGFSMQGMRVGGPYTVEISYIGYRPIKTEGVHLRLGEDFVLRIKMEETTEQLEELVVQASRNSIINSNRTGASTNVSSRELQAMPTISRSLSDFTRMTPQANGSSFAGRDGRFNRVTIDGAAFNNNFGLSDAAMPGGGAQPISLEAIEEVSVNIAPYDVRMSQFTGASINAVTKSGGNEIKGSAYTFLRPKSFTGQIVGKDTVRNARDREAQTYGLTIGGPIVKNKLFFFLSGEFENTVLPSGAWEPSTDGIGKKETKISRTTEADLEKVKNHLINKYDYDPGKYKNLDNFNETNYKILAKIDWNINNKNKFSIRYNTLRNSSDERPNYNSGPNRIRSSGRNSIHNITFSNSYYGFINKVDAVSAELNSVISKNASNRLLTSYTATSDTRTSNSTPFPFVDILQGGEHYMTLGYELFSWNNEVKNNTFSIQDNFTYKLGNHTLTAGLAYDNIFLKNNFAQYGTSYYRYGSMNQFLNDEKPDVFAMTYGYGKKQPEAVALSFGLASAYLQDEFRINENLKITGGIRFDLPLYHNKLINNPGVDNIAAFGDYKLNVGAWPKSQIMINPRLGFNWDVKGDRSIQMRGGTGLFSGVLPFVWFTNQPTNSGVYQNSVAISDTKIPADFQFNKDGYEQIYKYPNLFAQEPKSEIKNAMLAEVNKKFKMPQIWRSNLAVDLMLPYNMVLSLEGIFSKDIFGIVQRDLNLPEAQSKLNGPDQRPLWTQKTINNNLRRVMLLDNTNEGYQSSFTTQLVKNFSNGLSGMVAYTYSSAKDITSNPGSRANSAFENNSVYTSLNSPELSYSQFSVPHRIIGSISYRFEYAKHFATTVSLFYSGSHQGRNSYIIKQHSYKDAGGWDKFQDLNGDGSEGDLMFVPKQASDLTFIELENRNKNGDLLGVTSVEDQEKAFDTYINENPYLKTRKGNYTERNGGLQPWLNIIDMKIAQDIFTNFGTNRKYTLQLTLDIKNLGNLLNSNWGVRKTNGFEDQYGTITALAFKGLDENGVPKYTLNAKTDADFTKKAKTINNLSTSSTWGMLFGLRLLF